MIATHLIRIYNRRHNTVRLELNLPALERLIGGDTELELHLRQQIVQEFARRHLKEVTATATYEAALESAKQLVNEAAKESFDIENLATSHLWPTTGFRLKSMIEELVKQHAQKAVDEAVKGIIEYQKRYWGQEMARAVDAALNKELNRLIHDGIQQRLNAAAKV